MDPNATLDELRNLAQDAQLGHDPGQRAEMLDRMGKLVDALDGWLVKGGFLPDEWKAAAL